MDSKTGKKMMPPVKSSIVLGFKEFNNEPVATNVESRYQSHCNFTKDKRDSLADAQIGILHSYKPSKYDRSKSV